MAPYVSSNFVRRSFLLLILSFSCTCKPAFQPLPGSAARIQESTTVSTKTDVTSSTNATVFTKKIRKPVANTTLSTTQLPANDLDIRPRARNIHKKREMVNNGLPPGTVVAFASPIVPQGWLMCDGSLFDVKEYPDLFDVLGVNITPDLRNRFIFGYSNQKDKLGSTIHMRGGSANHTLSLAEIPKHTHEFNLNVDYAMTPGLGGDQGGNPVLFITSNFGSVLKAKASGGGQPFNMMPPYHVLMYIIKT